MNANDWWMIRCHLTFAGIFAIAQLIFLPAAHGATQQPGRLLIPANGKNVTPNPGLVELPHNAGFLYVPSSVRPGKALPFLILLHKASGNSVNWFPERKSTVPGPYARFAEKGGFAILAPQAPGVTWGVGPKSFGGEYQRINQTMEMAASHFNIDPKRIAIGGFSDGASYALSLGLANGDLISAIVVFSPGFIVRSIGRGQPSIFISHGLSDRVLPIDVTSRSFAQSLRKNGYNVTLQEFGGGHEVPGWIRDEAMQWLIAHFRAP